MLSWICLPVGLPKSCRVGVYSDMLRKRGGKVESPVKQSWI